MGCISAPRVLLEVSVLCCRSDRGQQWGLGVGGALLAYKASFRDDLVTENTNYNQKI